MRNSPTPQQPATEQNGDDSQALLNTALSHWISADAPDPAENLRLLIAEVNESSYSLAAWVDGLLALHEWLTARNMRVDFPSAIGYTGCCAALQGKGLPASDLRSAVLEMLDKYGMEAAQPL